MKNIKIFLSTLCSLLIVGMHIYSTQKIIYNPSAQQILTQKDKETPLPDFLRKISQRTPASLPLKERVILHYLLSKNCEEIDIFKGSIQNLNWQELLTLYEFLPIADIEKNKDTIFPLVEDLFIKKCGFYLFKHNGYATSPESQEFLNILKGPLSRLNETAVLPVPTVKITFSPKFGQQINTANISPDGKLLAIAGNNEKITIFDINSKKLIQTFKNANASKNIPLSVDGKYIAIISALDPKIVEIHSIEKDKIDTLSLKHTFLVKHLAYNKNSDMLIVSGNSASWIWDLKQKICIAKIPHDGFASQAYFVPQHDAIATISTKHSMDTISIWNMSQKKIINKLDLNEHAKEISFNQAGNTVFIATNTGLTIWIWKYNPEPDGQLTFGNRVVQTALLHPKLSLVAASFSNNSNDKGQLELDNILGTIIFPLTGDKLISTISFDTKGHLLTAASKEKVVIWQIGDATKWVLLLKILDYALKKIFEQDKKEGYTTLIIDQKSLVAQLYHLLPAYIQANPMLFFNEKAIFTNL